MSLSSSYTLQKKIIKKLRKRPQGKEGFSKRTFGDRLEATEYTVTLQQNGKTIQRQELFDWSKEEDEQIRYYSGTVVYKTTFRWKSKVKEAQQVYLNLGKVCDLATVRVNGIDCGTIWTAPYRADITAALKKGVK